MGEPAPGDAAAVAGIAPVVVPGTPVGPLPSAWRECVGTGRLNLALRADQKVLFAQSVGRPAG